MARGVIQLVQEDLRGTREGNLAPPRPVTLPTAARSSEVPMKDPRRCFLQRSASLTSPLQRMPMEDFINLFALTDMRPAAGGVRLASLETHLLLDFFFNRELNPLGTGFQRLDLLWLRGGFVCWVSCFLLLLFLGGCPRFLVAAAMGSPLASVVLAAGVSQSFFSGGHRQMRARHRSPGLAG